MNFENLANQSRQNAEQRLASATGLDKASRVQQRTAQIRASRNAGVPVSEEDFLTLNPDASLSDLAQYREARDNQINQNNYVQSLEQIVRDNNKTRSFNDFVSDGANIAAQSFVGLGETAYSVGEIASQMNLASQAYNAFQQATTPENEAPKKAKTLDEVTGGFSTVFSDAREYWDNLLQSDTSRIANERMNRYQAFTTEQADAEYDKAIKRGDNKVLAKLSQISDKATEAVKLYLRNPDQIAEASLEEIPQMLVGGLVGKTVTKGFLRGVGTEILKKQGKEFTEEGLEKVTKEFLKKKQGQQIVDRIGNRVGVSNAAVQEAGSNAMQSKAEVLNMSEAELTESSPAYIELREKGLTHEQARMRISDHTFNMTFGLILPTAGLISKVTGAGRIEGNLFLPNSKLKKIIFKNSTATVKEAFEEGLQGGTGQFIQNVATKTFANKNQALDEGVGEAIGTGAVVGAATGGGITAVTNIPSTVEATVSDTKKVVNKSTKAASKAINKITTPKVIKEAIKTGDASSITNTESTNYNPVDAINVLLDESFIPKKEEGKSAEDFKKEVETYKKELSKHSNNIVGQIQDSIKESQSNPDQAAKTTELLQQFEEISQNIKGTLLSLDNVKESVNTLNTEPENTEAKKAVLGSMSNVNNDSISLEEAQNIKDTVKLSKEESLIVDNFIEAKKAQETVSNEIYHGNAREGKLGLKHYIQMVNRGIEINDSDSVREALIQLRDFKNTMVKKNQDVQEAATRFQQTGEEQTNVGDNNYNIGGYSFRGSKSSEVPFITAVQQDAEQVENTFQTLRQNAISQFAKGNDNGRSTTVNEQRTRQENNNAERSVRNTELESEQETQTRTETIDPSTGSDAQNIVVESADRIDDTTVEPTEITLAHQEEVVSSLVYSEDSDVADVAQAIQDDISQGVTYEDALEAQRKANPEATDSFESAAEPFFDVISQTPETENRTTDAPTTETENVSEQNSSEEQSQKTEVNQQETAREAGTGTESNLITKAAATVRVYGSYLNNKIHNNKIASWFKQRKKRNEFNKTTDFFKEIDSIETLSESDKDSFRDLEEFKDKLKEALDKHVGQKVDKYANSNPIQLLMDEGAKKYSEGLDPNIINAMVLSAVNWIGSRGESTVNKTYQDIKQEINHRSDSRIPKHVYEFYNERGVADSSVKKELGEHVLKTLQLSINNNSNVPLTMQNGLALSIGQSLYIALEGMGILNTKTEFIPKNVWEFNKTPEEIKNNNKPQSFKHVKLNITNQESLNLLSTFKQIRSPLSEITQVENVHIPPKFTKRSNHPTTNNVNNKKLSKKQKAAVKKYNEKPWTVNTDFVNVLGVLGDDFVKYMMGFDKSLSVTEEKVQDSLGNVTTRKRVLSNKRHVSNLESIQGKNRDIQKSLTNLQEFLTLLEEEGNGLALQEFYFDNGYDGNDRLRMLNQFVNPQNDKLHRFAFKMEDWEYTVNDDFSREMFKFAVAQAFDIKLDKISYEDTIKQVNKILEDETNIHNIAAKALKELQTNSELSEQEQRALKIKIAKSLNEAGEKAHSLAGLIAINNYSKEGSFSATLPIEIDGRTSGTALALMQFAPEGVLEKLQKTGIYANGITSFNDWVTLSKFNIDSYEQLAKDMQEALNDVLFQNVRKQNGDEFTELEKSTIPYIGALLAKLKDKDMTKYGLTRSNSKNPVMIGNYGAGLGKIISEFADDIVGNFYDLIEDAVNNNDLVKLEGTITALENASGVKLIKSFRDPKQALYSVLDFKTENKLRNNIANTFGDILKSSYEKQFQELAQERNKFNSMFNAMAAMYRAAYETEVNKIIKDIKEKNKVINARNKEIREKEGAKSPNQIRRLSESITAKQDKEIKEKIKKYLPTLQAANTEDSEGIETHIPIISTARNQGQASININIETSVKGGITSLPKTEKIDTDIRGFSSNLARGSVNAIQSTDAAIQNDSLLADYNSLNVYDAVFINPLKALQAANVLNKSTLDSSKNNPLYLRTANKLAEMSKNFPTEYVGLATMYMEDYLARSLNKDTNLSQYLREIINNAQVIESRRESLFNNNLTINHYGMLGGQYDSKNPDNTTLRQLTDDFVKSIRKQVQSSPNSQQTYSGNVAPFDLNSGNVISLMTNLQGGVSKSSDKHHDYLVELLQETFNTVINPLKLKIQKSGDITEGQYDANANEISINVNTQKLQSNSEMGADEVYAHEIIHALTYTGLNGANHIANEIRKLWNEAREAITVDDLVPSSTDKAEAQRKYDYIFNNSNKTETGQLVGLHEFVAYGLTNEGFREVLKNKLDDARDETDTGSFFSKLIAIFNKILNRIKYKINGGRVTGDKQLTDLVKALTYSERKAKRKAYLNQVNKMEKGLNAGLRNYIVAPLDKFLSQDVFKRETDSRLLIPVQAVASVGRTVLNGRLGEFRKVITTALERLGATENNLILSMLNEMQGRTEDNNIFYELARASRHLLDQAKMGIAQRAGKYIKQSFSTELNKDQEISLTTVLLNTDLSSLLDSMNFEQIQRLFVDSKYLENEINKTKAALNKFQSYSNFYINNALSLGNFMVTRQFLNDSALLNAHAIAKGAGLPKAEKPRGNTNPAELLIDKLATLEALRVTSLKKEEEFNTVKDLVNTEFTVDTENNGITVILANHREFKENSKKKLFKNNPMQMTKGYTKDIYDPNKSFKVIPVGSSTQEEMEKDGYVYVGRVPKDQVDNGPDMDMYVLDMGDNSEWMSGSISITSLKAAGTTYFETMHVPKGIANRKAINQQAIARMKGIKERQSRIVANSSHNGKPKTRLIPILDESGNVVDFRYMMQDKTKFVLNPDTRITAVLGAMEASVTEKVNGKDINKRHVDALVADYNQGYQAEKHRYVYIGKSSNRQDLRDLYSKMPEDMRDEIKAQLGTDGIYVKQELVKLIFGQRRFTISNWAREKEELNRVNNNLVNHYLNPLYRALGSTKFAKAETIWMEVVKHIKDVIVVKSIGVLVNNVISNNVLLWSMGVPIKDIALKQTRAIQYAREHQQDSQEIDTIQRDIVLENQKTQPSVAKLRNLNKKIELLESKLKGNPVHELIEAGIFQTIIEDVDLAENEFSYKSQLEDWVSPFTDKVPQVVKDTVSTLAIGQDTKLYKFLRDSTQFSDFAARFALHEYNLSQGMSVKDSINTISDTFIDYDLPTHSGIEYLNNIGGIMFTKFLLRIQKVILNIMYKNPARFFGLGLIEELMSFNLEDISESFLLYQDFGYRFQVPLERLSAFWDTHPTLQLFK